MIMADFSEEFVAPPEAPVFEPNAEEFVDPLAYIAKIKPIAEKAGICKIRPPPDWQPPFAIDVDNFRFTPRVQCLRELEATTRVKLNFLEKLAKFWEFQGTPLKIPHVDKKILDLHTLFKVVHNEGGFERVTREKKWPRVAQLLGYPVSGGKCAGSTLRNHYEKLLYPFDLFESALTLSNQRAKKEDCKIKLDEVKVDDADYKPSASHSLGGRCAGRMQRNVTKGDEDIDYHANSELRKLQFFGAGPKAAIPVYVKDEQLGKTETRWKMRDRANNWRAKYMENDTCQICEKPDNENQLLICEGCDESSHTYCLVPPVAEITKVDWRCPKCIAKECNKPREAYGFAQAKKSYTLPEFGEMADQFKSDYFNSPVHLISTSSVEKEFWRLVSSIEEDITVQYGADIHSLLNGSGFPTSTLASAEASTDDEYICSGWNLNNLPVQERSILRWVTGDVSGMKVPWCYVGMCFSSFAWHIEDHWSYSVNYLHWGEPKTWYGAPAAWAEALEKVMKGCAPELFEQAPDLLHQLTTLMNPNALMARGIPIVRTNQCAGEFIVTFPRCYHAGFNQGYNFAEAVNFCPADWLPFGRACIESYKLVRRQCVFSHEELVCKMAADPDKLDLPLAGETYKELLAIVDAEKRQRKTLHDKGVSDAEREAFELVPDDERQCISCKTTCFLSAVTCPCKPGELVCIAHAQDLCSCSAARMCLRYRYTLDELPSMLHRLKNRADSYDIWSSKVKSAMNASTECKLPLSEFKGLLSEWKEKKLPDSPLLQILSNAVAEAEKCSTLACHLLNHKVLTRNRQNADQKHSSRLTFEELHEFCEQMGRLPCRLKEANLIYDLLHKVSAFQQEVQSMLYEDAILLQPELTLDKLGLLLESGLSLDVDVPEILQLKEVVAQVKWFLDVKPLFTQAEGRCRDAMNKRLSDNSAATLALMRSLLEQGASLVNPHTAVCKAMSDLQGLLTKSELCEEKALAYLQSKTKHKLDEIDAFINESQSVPAYLPNVLALEALVEEAREWNSKVSALQDAEHYPYVDVMKTLMAKGQRLPICLELLPSVESSVSGAIAWKEKASRTFLSKTASCTLLEVLLPRSDVKTPADANKKRKKRDAERELLDITGKVEEQDIVAMASTYKLLEKKELEAVCKLRAKNLAKQRECESRCSLDRAGLQPGIPSSQLLQCELCKDFFQGISDTQRENCLVKSKLSASSGTEVCIPPQNLWRELCSSCRRTKRPRMETVLSLLLHLHKLSVRIPEGEALRCLAERALAWQDNVRQCLARRQHRHQSVSSNGEGAVTLPIGAVAEPSRESCTVTAPQQDKGHINSNLTKAQMCSNDAKGKDDCARLPSAVHLHEHEEAGAELINVTELEDLVMEGDVLEVTLDESPSLWDVWHRERQHQEQLEQLSRCSHLVPECDDNLSIPMQSTDSCGLSAPEQPDEENRMEQPNKEERKRKGSQLCLDVGGAWAHAKSFQKKKMLLQVKGSTKTDSNRKHTVPDCTNAMHLNLDAAESSDEDDEEESCSASECLRPTSEEVDWVQCDQCQLWFHLLCIGLYKEEVSAVEEFVCKMCRTASSTNDTFSDKNRLECLDSSHCLNRDTATQSYPDEISGHASPTSSSLPSTFANPIATAL